ncbi:hypothetical protein Vafri_6675 [Volvox africanus]|nr:hypothetical protein Vafri_6675 [Volvox africanus]
MSSAFTAIWIGRVNSAPSDEFGYNLMTLSRTPDDFEKEFFFNTDESGIYWDTPNGFGAYSKYDPMPVGQWVMEVFVRAPGATSAFVARYGPSSKLQVTPLTSTPAPVDPDNLVVGADIRDQKMYLDGDVAVVMLFNRAVTTSELLTLAGFYAPRFGWAAPTGVLP